MINALSGMRTGVIPALNLGFRLGTAPPQYQLDNTYNMVIDVYIYI